jgi:DNA repair photolyase
MEKTKRAQEVIECLVTNSSESLLIQTKRSNIKEDIDELGQVRQNGA